MLLWGRTNIQMAVVPSILITDCLQNDFVGPVDKFGGIPNALHIGHDESLRLLSENPHEGPMARALSWAHQHAGDHLKVIHVRDWHDKNDPLQASHLQQFGDHCLQNTKGAEFVFEFDTNKNDSNINIVNSITLSNFINADLDKVLKPYVNQVMNVGLMGVWTEAKITFLAYDLNSRYPQFRLAVCSALTASSSRDNHFLALDQLDKILGVKIIPSVGEFIEFLGGKDENIPLLGFSHSHPTLKINSQSPLSTTDEQLVRYLFRGCKTVEGELLDGGFSGNAVIGTKSIDLHGHEQVPHVVKIGPKDLIGKERTAFERIEAVLGNSAPRIADFVDFEKRGAIKYRYASMGGGKSKSFQKIYGEGASQSEINRILDIIFDEQLGRFYRAAEARYCDLFEYYEFKPKWAGSVAAKVKEIMGFNEDQSEITFANGKKIKNVSHFYQNVLPTLTHTPKMHYFSYVHGDLNGANIIIDKQNNIWIIDFFHTHKGHVLKDLIKIENDLLYIFTKINTEAELIQAMTLSETLVNIKDLSAPLPPLDKNITMPALLRAYETINHLRGFYPNLIQSDRAPFQWHVAHLRYSVQTLGFVESSPLQKIWALYSSCLAAKALTEDLERSNILRIDYLPSANTFKGKVGLTIAPGRRDMNRNLIRDIEVIQNSKTDIILCLLTFEEMKQYGIDDLLAQYKKSNLSVKHQPIIDGKITSVSETRELIQWLNSQLNQGKNILIHCAGGLGRAGSIAACFLKAQGYSAEEAINMVRKSRSPRAIETSLQENFIKNFQYQE